MIEPILLAVTCVATFEAQQAKTNATGFFFKRGQRLFIVTSRHVLRGGGIDVALIELDRTVLPSSGLPCLYAGPPLPATRTHRSRHSGAERRLPAGFP